MNRIKVTNGGIVEGTVPEGPNAGQKYSFVVFKQDKGNGILRSIKMITPSLIAKNGFRELVTKKGTLVKTIISSLDMNNPHHRQFFLGPYMGVYTDMIDFMIDNPSKCGIKGNDAIAMTKNKKGSTIYNQSYNQWFTKLLDEMGSCFRYPVEKIPNSTGDGFDEFPDKTSNLRTIFLNPLEFKGGIDKSGKEIKPSYMIAYIPGDKQPYTMEELEAICLGYETDNDGNIVKGKPKGFEYSAELLVNRGVFNAITSLQIKTSVVYVHRFFDAPEYISESDIHRKQVEELSTQDEDFTRVVGVRGFKIPVKAEPITGSHGNTNNLTSTAVPMTEVRAHSNTVTNQASNVTYTNTEFGSMQSIQTAQANSTMNDTENFQMPQAQAVYQQQAINIEEFSTTNVDPIPVPTSIETLGAKLQAKKPVFPRVAPGNTLSTNINMAGSMSDTSSTPNSGLKPVEFSFNR